MVSNIINSVAVVVAAISLVWLAWFVARPDHQREEEDAARDFFDRHGRWPDEPESG